MQLSLIIPAYNAGLTLPLLLDSIALQQELSEKTVEFILVDDGSNDHTLELMQRYPWVKTLSQPQQGAGAARNLGAQHAKGRYLLFLDADTRIKDPLLIQKVVRFFERHPDQDGVSGCYNEINPATHAFARYLDLMESTTQQGALDAPSPGTLNGCLCALKRDTFFRAGSFAQDPRIHLEDPDLACRIEQLGGRLWFSGSLRVEHLQPTLREYLPQLFLRSRDYLRLILHYRSFNPAMGGAAEGWRRLGYSLLPISLLLGFIDPIFFLLFLTLLLLPLGTGDLFLRRLISKKYRAILPTALFFHLICSWTTLLGGALGLLDRMILKLRQILIDVRVVAGYLQTLFKPNSLGQLIHFVTHRCNARCEHCFDTPQRERIDQRAEMNIQQIHSLARSCTPLAHLSLTGGEPFLRRDLAEIIAIYYRQGIRSIGINSNGAYPKRVQTLLQQVPILMPLGRLTMSLSMDGQQSQHDSIRGIPGLFEHTLQSLQHIDQARQWLPQLRLHVNITVGRQSETEINQLLTFLEPFACDQIDISRLRGSPADSNLMPVSIADYRNISSSIANSNRRNNGLSRLFSRLDRDTDQAVLDPLANWPKGRCLAGKRLIEILADGRVIPCEMLAEVGRCSHRTQFEMGYLAEHQFSLRRVLQSEQAKRVNQTIKESQCRCSFECGIFISRIYRPWTILGRMIGRLLPAYSSLTPISKECHSSNNRAGT